MGTKNIYERFIWFDTKVRHKRYPNATTLAAEFEMSVKTAQRDIEFMRDRLNCPLLYDKRTKGYYYSDDTFSLPLVYLSSAELSSLLIARKMLQDINGPIIAEDISSIVHKITTILQKHIADTRIVDDKLSFKLIAYTPTPEKVFKVVLESCIRKVTISFTYYSPAYDQTNIRTVDPYHLFDYMGTWHLIGYCHTRKALRDFVLARMSEPMATNETFKGIVGFDIKKYLDRSFGLYKGNSLKGVTLRFTPVKAKWLRGQIWHKDQKERILEDGSLELSFPVADFSEIAREILKHGSGVEVVKPESLRQMIKSEAEAVLKIY